MFQSALIGLMLFAASSADLCGAPSGSDEVSAASGQPTVGIEKASRAGGFTHLPLPKDPIGTITANQKVVDHSLDTLVDGKLAQGYGPVFNNGVKDGAYKMDLGKVQPVAAINSWSYSEGGRRGVQKVSIFGSDASSDPGWDLAEFVLLGTIDTGKVSTEYTAASLRAPLKKSLGSYRWIVWAPSPISDLGGGENTAFQELSVETGVNQREVPAESVENAYLSLIPEDKNLDPVWVQSLFERGEKEVYRSEAAMQHIGMPVGGLFAGTVYLSGDGRLYNWDIFNKESLGILPGRMEFEGRSRPWDHGALYVDPMKPEQAFQQGFAIRANGKEVSLDGKGFKDVSFRGEYPRAIVSFKDSDLPVSAELEAFSPFIPMNPDDSELPATVMEYTVKNEGGEALELTVAGSIENAVNFVVRDYNCGQVINQVVDQEGFVGVECTVKSHDTVSGVSPREAIEFETFDASATERWTGTGSAFEKSPFGDNQVGKVNTLTFDPADGKKLTGREQAHANKRMGLLTGTLTSRPFKIERQFITASVGGAADLTKLGLYVLVDPSSSSPDDFDATRGEVVASTSGSYGNQMMPVTLDVSRFEGKVATIEIRDHETPHTPHLRTLAGFMVDDIVFTDTPDVPRTELEELPDFGTMSLALLGDGVSDASMATKGRQAEVTAELGDSIVGEVGRSVRLAPGEEATFTFVVSWHVPNYGTVHVPREHAGRHYASRFASSTEVTAYLVKNSERLFGETRQWVETWYDSSLPYWFLDRTMANTSTLATMTSQRFKDGRFWGWEGVSSCSGTCSHVWQYAQAVSRLFPSIERRTRDESDFGIGFSEKGGIGHRINMSGGLVADDGQLGRILSVYREHQMTTDNAFLERMWPRVKKGMDYIIGKDTDRNGVIDGSYQNTLDGKWYGRYSWAITQYVAGLRAAEAMANEIGDTEYAKLCKGLADQGATAVDDLFNGEYFIQDKGGQPDSFGHGYGCFIDQVFGQSWAHWVGLGHIIDVDMQRTALRSIYRYNFIPDFGPYREVFPNGRVYALPGDAGLLMCTWPKEPAGKGEHHIYFFEIMSGFEWQAASHMIFEGLDEPDLLEKGLVVSRAIHDRYSAELRNPYNEIECGDHYARAMASYGAYQAMSGYQYHGPKGELSFAPRLSPEDFRAAFTVAEGWGSFVQRVDKGRQSAEIDMRYGTLELKQLSLAQVKGTNASGVSVTLDGKSVRARLEIEDGNYVLIFDSPVRVNAGQGLLVAFE